MKKNIFILLVFFSVPLFSQSPKNNSATVEYKAFYNTGVPFTMYTTLFIDKEATIYFEKYSTTVIDPKATADGSRIVLPDYPFEPYTKLDHAKKKVFLYGMIKGNIFLVEDNYSELKWDITEETKDIAGYSCIKATTNYRGRGWVAWFALELPMPYGPWKLHGLPGLIVEAYDSSNTYTMQAVKIEFKMNGIFDKDFTTLYSAKNSKPMMYEQFLKDEQEYYNNAAAAVIKETGSTYKPQPRNGLELKYEWEE